MEPYGRPRMQEEERLDSMLYIPVTKAMRAQFEKEARQEGHRTLAAYLRRKLEAMEVHS